MPEEQSEKKRDARKVNNDFFRALDECAEALSLDELSRVSGVTLVSSVSIVEGGAHDVTLRNK